MLAWTPDAQAVAILQRNYLLDVAAVDEGAVAATRVLDLLGAISYLLQHAMDVADGRIPDQQADVSLAAYDKALVELLRREVFVAWHEPGHRRAYPLQVRRSR